MNSDISFNDPFSTFTPHPLYKLSIKNGPLFVCLSASQIRVKFEEI
jgi:hypothetical protein